MVNRKNVINLIIKNFNELSKTDLRRSALEIIKAGITAVLPKNILKDKVQYNQITRTITITGDSYELRNGRLFVIGGGKAAGEMAEVLETIIPPEDITAGVVNCIAGEYRTRRIDVNIASHPIPNQASVDGTQQILALKNKYSITKNDLIICLISGGGSALMTHPVPDVSLEDMQEMTELLIQCGAEIAEMNIVRKHLSRIKGGQLSKYYSPTTVISLIISDVVGNDLGAIASGPTTSDSSSFADAYKILKKYDILSKVPESIIKYIEDNLDRSENETPKYLDNCKNYIIGDNKLALDSMVNKASEFGYKPRIITSEQKGETAPVAKRRAVEILSGKFVDNNAFILGGETTPVLPEHAGTGGRNQHYIAVSMLELANYKGNWTLASVATDGADYMPEVAGVIIDNESLDDAKEIGLDVKSYIDAYDSNTLFKKLGNSIIKTGPTGTNVGDIVIYIFI